MSNKLRKAIGAVKDQTSISLAKVTNNNSSNLEVAVLKATTHDEVPIEERYVNEVLFLTSSSKLNAAVCAQAIAKRIGRTRTWIVALKSLILVLRIFQDGNPHFPKEVLQVMRRGAKILNLSSFREDSNSSPWDYTAFVHTFAIYLNERLDCFLTGKLQRCVTYQDKKMAMGQRGGRRVNEPVRDMKPAMLLDRISYWQRLLERAIATKPTGAAKTNRLVQIALYYVVQESFDLYRDVSDGLALLLDSFFHLQYKCCVNAFQTCVKASKQFGELCAFYSLCKNIGVGRTSEYPSVQKISVELIETLQEFLKDQASFTTISSCRTQRNTQLLLPVVAPESVSGGDDQSELVEGRGTSLEDIMSVTDDTGTSPSSSLDRFEPESNIPSVSAVDLLSFDDDEQSQLVSGSEENTRECWELVLAETASNIVGGFDSSFFLSSLYDQASSQQEHVNNPFLQDMAIVPVVVDPFFSSFIPTFGAAPTFSVQQQNPNNLKMDEDDPFAAPGPTQMGPDQILNGTMNINQQNVLHEQQLWLQNQNKIIARHLAS